MKNNDLIGKVVLSNCGRDKNQYYVVIDSVDENYYLLSNGRTKTIQLPKKKNLKHFDVLEDIDEDIKLSFLSNEKAADLKIKRFLKLKGIVKEG